MKSIMLHAVIASMLLCGASTALAVTVFDNLNQPSPGYAQLDRLGHKVAQQFITTSATLDLTEMVFQGSYSQDGEIRLSIYKGGTTKPSTNEVAVIYSGSISSLGWLRGSEDIKFSGLDLQLQPNTIYWAVFAITTVGPPGYWGNISLDVVPVGTNQGEWFSSRNAYYPSPGGISEWDQRNNLPLAMQITAVPEPSTACCSVLASVLILSLRRRRI